MKIFKDIGYGRKQEVELKDKNIVDILTSQECSSVRLGYYDKDFDRKETEFFGINYANNKVDRAPVQRAIEFENSLLEIDPCKKLLIKRPIEGQMSFDEDKIPFKDQYVVEGSVKEILREFRSKGYKIVKK